MQKHKVLIITYLWPPMEGVGLIRAFKFAKYLPEYGWQPVVLTVKEKISNLPHIDICHPEGIKVFRTEYRDGVEDIKKFFHLRSICEGSPYAENIQDPSAKKNRLRSFVRELITMPDDQIGWYKFAVEEGKKIIEEENIDIIFSTSPPETAHLVARKLKKYCNVPWVADLRDLWADDHFRHRPLYKKIVLKLVEKNVLKDADFLITVSEPWARKLRSALSSHIDRIKIIENGYDDEDFNSYIYTKNEKFTIAYTGKLHKERQPVNIFFKALRDLIEEGRIDRNKIFVKFYLLGYDKPDITDLAGRYGLGDVVKEFGKVDYNKSLEIQRSSDLLLFVQWQGESGDGWYSAKLYDYIGARRPILVMGKPKEGIIADLIRRTSSGIIANGMNDLKRIILELYNEYMTNGYIKYYGNDQEIKKCTRRQQTEKLTNTFNLLFEKTMSKMS